LSFQCRFAFGPVFAVQGLGAIEQVKDHSGAFAIGVDVNQDALVPGKILTSMVKRVDVGVLTLAKTAATGNAPTGHIELGLKDGAVGLTDFKYTRNVLAPAQFKTIAELRTAVINGKIIAPSTREMLAAFKPVNL